MVMLYIQIGIVFHEMTHAWTQKLIPDLPSFVWTANVGEGYCSTIWALLMLHLLAGLDFRPWSVK